MAGRGAYATEDSLNVPNEDSNRLRCRQRLENLKSLAHRVATMIRILLAEDDTSMREYLQRALQRVGYAVEAVGCGTEAMPLLEAGKYDRLLTDIGMPEMDGIEAMKHIRRANNPIPVIAMTAGTTHDEVVRCMEAGANDLVAKPFDPNELICKMAALVMKK